jgi:uncharacterized protein (TIGR04255 family)
MARIRPLARAPITEALVDLRVQPAEGMTVERLEQALQSRNFGYHRKGPILRSHFGIVMNLQDGSPAQQRVMGGSTIVGVRLHSADDKYVAQFTTESFTVSRLEPYESWGALMAEAQRVWADYRACVAPVSVHRVATRFINNLRLPLKPAERFERYLTGLPQMPPEYPQTVSSFLQRFVIQDDACGATAIVTQALEQVPQTPPVPVILDIDVFREARFPPDTMQVWDFLTDLRALKNRLFFGALTEDALRLYE